MATDVLRDDQKPITVLEILTDGVWTWPSDLPYYVETYHAQVPEELIVHASNMGWAPPALDTKALAEIEERLFLFKPEADSPG